MLLNTNSVRHVSLVARMLAAPALLLASPAAAQDSEAVTALTHEQTAIEARADQVVAVVNGELAPEEVFTDGFLAAVPPAQLAEISRQLTGQFGAALTVESLDPAAGTRAGLAIRMERAIARGGIAIDPDDDNRISELLFQTFDPIDDTPAKIETDLAALPGEVSYFFGPLGGSDPVLARAVDAQMALGSTFKLYVLAALASEIADGKRSWNDVVTLNTRSFPSGMMQDWPENAPVTLHTLASLMISISDNTATDQLIRLLGRDAVLQVMIDSGHSQPALNNPFLTTRELFLLKGGADGLAPAYSAGDTATRLGILGELERNPASLAQINAVFANGPVNIDVEWFASAADLMGLFAFMQENADARAFEVMAINPSMPGNIRENWAYAGFKGGSEPGVLNLTWLLKDHEGRDHALVLSWNNPQASLDQTALELIGQRILSLSH
ncbi:serine hydrolase [Qipengyuania sp. ASV99]|uniref:serine hydrolase n=1 Tax=Qipengyuania sp. ASV99 TaxID=3399681 RepID=UPI003A4C6F16